MARTHWTLLNILGIFCENFFFTLVAMVAVSIYVCTVYACRYMHTYICVCLCLCVCVCVSVCMCVVTNTYSPLHTLNGETALS